MVQLAEATRLWRADRSRHSLSGGFGSGAEVRMKLLSTPVRPGELRRDVYVQHDADLHRRAGA